MSNGAARTLSEDDAATKLLAHAQQLLRHKRRPAYAVLVEFYGDEEPDVSTFGVPAANAREGITVLVDTTQVLGDAIQALNATAAN